MTDPLTTMRQLVADAENDLERLRAAIAVLEQAEGRRSPRRTGAHRRKTPTAPTQSPRSTRPPRAPQDSPSADSTPSTSRPAGRSAAPQKPPVKARTTPAKPAAAHATQPAAPASETADKPAARTRRRAALTRTQAMTVVVPLEKLLTVIGEQPGLTTTALAKQTGGKQSALLDLLKESEQRGEVRREGSRRATSWYRITDEDRIAARAAELTAQATRTRHRSTAKP